MPACFLQQSSIRGYQKRILPLSSSLQCQSSFRKQFREDDEMNWWREDVSRCEGHQRFSCLSHPEKIDLLLMRWWRHIPRVYFIKDMRERKSCWQQILRLTSQTNIYSEETCYALFFSWVQTTCQTDFDSAFKQVWMTRVCRGVCEQMLCCFPFHFFGTSLSFMVYQ